MTTPTSNPVPSNNPNDLLFNAEQFDVALNSTAASYTDRLGVARRTVKGQFDAVDAELAAKLDDAQSQINVKVDEATASAADAADSALEALGYLQVYRTTSYGPYASDPATDPLGNPPSEGDEYWNTVAKLTKRFNGTTWQASDINTANLAASSGSSLIGFDGGTAQGVLDNAKAMQSYAALRAYTGRATGVRITTPGIDGFFQRLGTAGLADNGGTIIIDASGRAWERVTEGGVLNVLWFGADRTGITSSVTAVNNAISALNAAANSIRLFFPKGVYNLKSGVTQKITRSNVTIEGADAVINCESGNIFDFDSGASLEKCALYGFYFSYPSVIVDANATPAKFTRCLYLFVNRIRVSYAPSVFYFSRCSNVSTRDVQGLTANVARAAIYINYCSVMYFDDTFLINNAGLPPVNPSAPYPDPPVVGNSFIRVEGGHNDTIYFKSGVLCNRYRRGLHATVSAADESFINVLIDACVFDLCYDKGVFIENLGGSVANIHARHLYIQASKGDGFHLKTAGGGTNLVWIESPQILFSGFHSIYVECTISANSSSGIFISKPFIYGGNALNSGGIDIYCINSRVDIDGGSVGINSLAYTGYSAQATRGVVFDGCDRYTVSGIASGGSAGSFAFVNNPATDYRARLVYDNKIAVGSSVVTKPEYESSTLVSVTSGEVYTNASPYKEYVSVYGTSASGAATIAVNGNQYSTRSEWSGILNPGDTLSVTTAIACSRRITRLP